MKILPSKGKKGIFGFLRFFFGERIVKDATSKDMDYLKESWRFKVLSNNSK